MPYFAFFFFFLSVLWKSGVDFALVCFLSRDWPHPIAQQPQVAGGHRIRQSYEIIFTFCVVQRLATLALPESSREM